MVKDKEDQGEVIFSLPVKKESAKRRAVDIRAIHKYWQTEIMNEEIEWSLKIGDLSFETILETNGSYCYACGRKSHVQKCHIIPHHSGGDEHPSNMFLMCYKCHALNPDTNYPEIFYAFVKTTNFYVQTDLVEFVAACDKYESTLDRRDQVMLWGARRDAEAIKCVTPLLLEELGKCCGAMGANTVATKAGLFIKLLLAYVKTQEALIIARKLEDKNENT